MRLRLKLDYSTKKTRLNCRWRPFKGLILHRGSPTASIIIIIIIIIRFWCPLGCSEVYNLILPPTSVFPCISSRFHTSMLILVVGCLASYLYIVSDVSGVNYLFYHILSLQYMSFFIQNFLIKFVLAVT
jgi:hypothetical protein